MRFIKQFEPHVKKLIVCLLIYTFSFLIVEMLFHEFNDWKFFLLPIHSVVYSVFSIAVFMEFKSRKDKSFTHFLFNLDEDELDENDSFVKVLRIAGYFLLYWTFQLAFMIYLFPDFAKFMIGNVPLYVPLFVSNSFIITLIYKRIYKEDLTFSHSK